MPTQLKVQNNDEDNLPADERQNLLWKPGSEKVGVIFNLQETDTKVILTRGLHADVEKYNKGNLPKLETASKNGVVSNQDSKKKGHKSKNADIMKGRNIGEHDGWYPDARFAQQHLSRVNPSTIETAPAEKVKAFIVEAEKQGLEQVKKLLEDGQDLFIQDYSYFRKTTGIKDDQIFQNRILELDDKQKPTEKLHPIVITLDYRGSLDNSITIFNRRLTPDDKGNIDKKHNWPWRYAKTVAQTADWARHEIATHLVDTRMIEEVIIVAINITIPEGELLTLTLNAAARKLLVPGIIARIAGFGPSSPSPPGSNIHAHGIVDWSYKNFNFQDKYIPNDLKKRGFDLEGETGDKYRNYPYATDMYLLWGIIRDFVKSALETQYTSDKVVQNDPYIGSGYEEIQTKGQIPSFSTITTVDQLIDAVTMYIHTASPQHTAVNYLQDHYYSFVPSNPPALCRPLPQDLKTLETYTEKHLTEALPIGTGDVKWKDWLPAAQLPELLSFKVEDRYNLITYAKSLYNVNKERTIEDNRRFNAVDIRDAAAVFYSRLKDAGLAFYLGTHFEYVSAIQTEGSIEYPVLQPEVTVISILI
ncbi:hypothetical protein ACHAPJ_013584 [Fusarium lateritium]